MTIYKIITIFAFYTRSCLIGMAQKININAYLESIKLAITISGNVSCITKVSQKISPVNNLGLSFHISIFCLVYGDNLDVKSNNGHASPFRVKPSLNLSGK